MTLEDIIRLAREVGGHEHYASESDDVPWSVEFSLTNIAAFAALVAAAEREACAETASCFSNGGQEIAEAIRSRGET